MNTCGGCSAGQRAQRFTRALEREPAVISGDGRHLELGKVGGIDVRRLERAHATGTGRSGVPSPPPTRGVRGFDPAEPPSADKATELTPTPRFGASLGSRSARSRRSCRQARGRWRPDDREVVRRRPWTNGGNAAVPGTSSKPGAGGFSHGTRRAVSEGGVSSRVLVTRNVGCRSDFEASWRCDQGTPQGITRRNVEATEKVEGPDGAGGHSPRRRVLRACKGRKAGAGPSVMDPANPLAHDRASSRSRKARGDPRLASVNPARGHLGPGSGTPVRQPGGCRAMSRGDIHAPEAQALRSFPQPMGAGSSRPLCPLQSGLMPHEGIGVSAARAKNPGISPRPQPRERPPRDEKPTANDDATRRRKRVWRTEPVE